MYSDLRWPPKTGIGRVMTAMVERKPAHVELVRLNVTGGIGSPFSARAVGRALKRETAGRQGVYWSAGFVPPTPMVLPSVVTVHDLMHLHFYTRLHAAYYNLYLRPLYRRCTAIVCSSHSTRREFVAWSGVSPERCFVVYLGVDRIYLENQEPARLPFPYVLYPGNHRRYKNLKRLILGYAASALPRAGVHLAITGNADEALAHHAARVGVRPNLHFLGRVDDEVLPRIYKGALFVAFVSLCEGFGLPIVEAMASGVPVLTSNLSAMAEVAGDAALTVDPYSVEAITKGLNTLATDNVLREELVAKGRERLRRFDWVRSARELWNIGELAYADD